MAEHIRCNHEDATSWEVAKNRLSGLKDGESVTLDAGPDAFLIVLVIADLGYYVTGCGVREKDYFTLVERSLGDDPVTAFNGGDTNVYPRHTFVTQTLMLRAAQAYHQNGQRDPACEWVPEEDAVYD
jgi:hypothetical protein